MKRSAIVLGAAGFLGRHVAKTLAVRGYTVFGAGHGGWDAAGRAPWSIAQWHEADITLDVITDIGVIPDILVQCAGSGSVAGSLSEPLDDFSRNVGTTIAALEFVRLHAPECRFVLPSSAAVYGTVADLPIRIDAPLRPVSPYGVHKMICEQVTQSYCRHFNVAATIVRLFSIYGPGLRKQLLWDACGKLVAGNAVFGGTGYEERDWLHVEDAADLLAMAALHASVGCPIVNGGTGVSTDIRRIVSLLRTELAPDAEVTFNGSRRSGDPDCYRADMALPSGWEWQPKHVLTEQVRQYAAWFASLGA